MDSRFGPVDRAVAVLAERQEGVVEHGQVRALGLSETAIRRRVAAGRLHPLHVGVYAVGHRRVSVAGRRLAAVLACGPGAALSHHTAGDHLGVRPVASPRIHVTIPNRSGRARPGIVIHRPRRLPSEDVVVHEGIPVTSVARTLRDLARSVDVATLRKVLERAERLRMLDLATFAEPLPRKLRLALADMTPATLDSDLESDFLSLCRTHGLPLPETNVLVAGHWVDAFWRDAGVVAEIDGWAYHGTRAAFERDRRRDLDLALAGLTVIRLTHRAIVRDAEATAGSLGRLLGR